MNDVSINVLLVMGYHDTAKLNTTMAPPPRPVSAETLFGEERHAL